MNLRGLAAAVVLLLAWQLASYFTPDYLFPPLQTIAADLFRIFTDSDAIVHALTTVIRILAGATAAFLLGTLLGLVMAERKRFDEVLRPLLNFVQGVPALSWVIIAVIWFREVEVRIFFILLVVAIPNFAFQAFDSYNAMAKDLREMMLVLRPTSRQMFRMLTLPSVLPGLLTGWKVNIGNITRVVIVAELVGATVGVGYQLQSAQAVFNMSQAIAWTLVLVAFVVLAQAVIAGVERALLSWRPRSER
jgi:ABC-type nitrate/sulfonate/bicarbonate transport system permease component